MKKWILSTPVKKFVVGKIASFAEAVAQDSADGRCFAFIYQPKEPDNMAERLNLKLKKQSLTEL